MKNKGRIKKIYTSIRYRMVSICLSVAVFILVMLAALVVELYENEQNYIAMYEKQQALFVNQLKNQFVQMYEEGKADASVITYLSEQVEASGGRFFVFTKENQVLFAKNDITTEGLGTFSDKTEFYKSIEDQEIIVEKASFLADGKNYEIAVISDIYTIKTEGQLIKHQYYILLVVAVMSVVLISLLVTLVGSWNRTQRKLEGTRKELNIRNEKIEMISQETGAAAGDKTDILEQREEIGITQSKETEFYNIYTLQMLLQKSEDVQLKPLQMFFLNVVMKKRYFGKDEIFGVMRRIQKTLRKVEVMGEVRKGQFVILAYRTSVKEAEERLKEIQDICRQIEEDSEIIITSRLVKEDSQTAIERFENMKNLK